jgi:lysozyme
MQVIKLGASGDEVFMLRKLLRKIGYQIAPDGDFDALLDTKVKKYQGLRNLKQDGIVGSGTWASVFQSVTNAVSTFEMIDIYHSDIENASPKTGFPWQAVQDNHWGVFVKATQDSDRQDGKFQSSMNEMAKRNILRGAYHFMDLTHDNVSNQVDNFLNTCNLDFTEKGILPPVLDVEPLNDKQKPIIQKDKLLVVKRVQQWLDAVQAATGKTPIIYTASWVWDDLMGSPKGFEKYPLWVAHYGAGLKKPKLPSPWQSQFLWQYTDAGTVGTQKGFDVNRLNIPLAKLYEMANY